MSFQELVTVIGHESRYDSIDMKWFTNQEIAQFKESTNTRAEGIVKAMIYVQKIDDTFNPSIGLTSPQILHEYISSPTDIIGIEHLLLSDNESTARKILIAHHVQILLEEQQKINQTGQSSIDTDLSLLLASSLKDSSVISANMAKKRAEYIRYLE